jgi:hypothetical protein
MLILHISMSKLLACRVNTTLRALAVSLKSGLAVYHHHHPNHPKQRISAIDFNSTCSPSMTDFTFKSSTLNNIQGDQINVTIENPTVIIFEIHREVGFLAFLAFVLWLYFAYVRQWYVFSLSILINLTDECADPIFVRFAMPFGAVRTSDIALVCANFDIQEYIYESL